jgi:hypothetical protein
VPGSRVPSWALHHLLSSRAVPCPVHLPVGSPIELRMHHGWIHAGPVRSGCQVVFVDTVFQAVWDSAWKGTREGQSSG